MIVTPTGFLIIAAGIIIGFLMIDTGPSQVARGYLKLLFNRIIPDPSTTSTDRIVFFFAGVALISVIFVYLFRGLE